MSRAFFIIALLTIAPAFSVPSIAQQPGTAANTQDENKATASNQTSQTDNKVFPAKQVDKKVSIKSRPNPEYPYWLRGNAKVVLRAIFRASGEVTDIKVVSVYMSYPSGMQRELAEKCIEVARKIKFKPAVKDGQPVSQYMQIEYNFLVPM